MFVLRIIYDIFIVVIMINCVLSDQLIKKDILFVSDIYIVFEKINYLLIIQMIVDYQVLFESIYYFCFLVVNKKLCLVGIVIVKDVIGKSEYLIVDKVMIKDFNVVKKMMSVVSVSY